MYDNEENTSIDEELDILLDDFVLDEDDDFDLDSELDRVLNEAEEDETGDQEGREDSGQQAQRGQTAEISDENAQEEDQNQDNGDDSTSQEGVEDSGGETDNTEGEEGSTEDGTDGGDAEDGDGSEEDGEDSGQDPEAAAEETSENKEKQYYFEVFSDLYDNVKLFVEKTADLMESYTEEDNKTLLISIQDELYNLKQDLELLLIEKIKIMPLENLNIVYVSISSKVKILLDIIEKISSSEVKKV